MDAFLSIVIFLSTLSPHVLANHFPTILYTMCEYCVERIFISSYTVWVCELYKRYTDKEIALRCA